MSNVTIIGLGAMGSAIENAFINRSIAAGLEEQEVVALIKLLRK